MKQAVLTYRGFLLYESGRGYRSYINDEWVSFDTVSQWVKFINIQK
jgi:hypothetical protein